MTRKCAFIVAGLLLCTTVALAQETRPPRKTSMPKNVNVVSIHIGAASAKRLLIDRMKGVGFEVQSTPSSNIILFARFERQPARFVISPSGASATDILIAAADPLDQPEIAKVMRELSKQ